MYINIEKVPNNELKELYSDPDDLVFGETYTDHMFVMKYDDGKGWYGPSIKKFEDFCLSPAALVFHYAQEVFEGMKAYINNDGEVVLFRPEQNIQRLNRSCTRMCIPTLAEADILQAIKEAVKIDKRWIPAKKGCSLYIRPTVIATEPKLGVRASKSYLFFIILSPVGPYFKEGFNPIGLYVSDKYIRAAEGGVGEAKTGGNYAASLLAGQIAKQKGYSQVLWLDAKENKYVEEVGAMNIFFVIDGELHTPKLTGSILRGITRMSILELAQDKGYTVKERDISIDEVIQGIENDQVTECFGAGTAAIIAPVGKIHYKDTDYEVNNYKVGPMATELYESLLGIQYGKINDKFNWITKVS